MAGPLRFFVSHSSADTPLALALQARLEALPGVQVFVDASGLEAGEPWRRQLHEKMARCNAGIVLLTQGVLDKPKWVLKEAIILGWRLDVEPKFPLFFALAPGLSRQAFDGIGFDLAQLSETQLMPKGLADPAQVDALVAALEPQLPAALAKTPYDEIVTEVGNLLKMADRDGITYDAIAAHLGLAQVAGWGPNKLGQFAEEIARALVEGRDGQLAIDGLVFQVKSWLAERRLALARLLAPFWIEAEAGAALRRRAPPPLRPGAPPAAVSRAAVVTIAAGKVPDFTAEMTVRRAFGPNVPVRIAPNVGLGGDLFEQICNDICDFARHSAWVRPPTLNNEIVIRKLSDSVPIFVALGSLPDAQTLTRLGATFPRALFVAPRPLREVRTGDELEPDPDPVREAAEFASWETAMSAIENG